MPKSIDGKHATDDQKAVVAVPVAPEDEVLVDPNAGIDVSAVSPQQLVSPQFQQGLRDINAIKAFVLGPENTQYEYRLIKEAMGQQSYNAFMVEFKQILALPEIKDEERAEKLLNAIDVPRLLAAMKKPYGGPINDFLAVYFKYKPDDLARLFEAHLQKEPKGWVDFEVMRIAIKSGFRPTEAQFIQMTKACIRGVEGDRHSLGEVLLHKECLDFFEPIAAFAPQYFCSEQANQLMWPMLNKGFFQVAVLFLKHGAERPFGVNLCISQALSLDPIREDKGQIRLLDHLHNNQAMKWRVLQLEKILVENPHALQKPKAKENFFGNFDFLKRAGMLKMALIFHHFSLAAILIQQGAPLCSGDTEMWIKEHDMLSFAIDNARSPELFGAIIMSEGWKPAWLSDPIHAKLSAILSDPLKEEFLKQIVLAFKKKLARGDMAAVAEWVGEIIYSVNIKDCILLLKEMVKESPDKSWVTEYFKEKLGFIAKTPNLLKLILTECPELEETLLELAMQGDCVEFIQAVSELQRNRRHVESKAVPKKIYTLEQLQNLDAKDMPDMWDHMKKMNVQWPKEMKDNVKANVVCKLAIYIINDIIARKGIYIGGPAVEALDKVKLVEEMQGKREAISKLPLDDFAKMLEELFKLLPQEGRFPIIKELKDVLQREGLIPNVAGLPLAPK